MKRSEMINRISNYIKPNYETKISPETECFAIGILEVIEAAGMKPPSYFTKEDLELKEEPDSFQENLYFGYEGIQKWEAEDEKD